MRSAIGVYDLVDARLGLSPANLSHAVEFGLWTAGGAVAAFVLAALTVCRRKPLAAVGIGGLVVLLRTTWLWLVCVASAAV